MTALHSIKNMLTLQLTVIMNRLVLLIAALFLFILLTVAFSFAGWMDDLQGRLFSGWTLLLLWNYTLFFLITAKNHEKLDFFYALGKLTPWCTSQIIVLIILSCSFFIPWNLLLIPAGITFWDFCIHSLSMFLFSTVFAQSILDNLQSRLTGINENKKWALYIIISAPWTLTSWLLGLHAAQATLFDNCFSLFWLALAALGCFQLILGRCFNNTSDQRN